MKKWQKFVVGFLVLASLGWILQILGLAPKSETPKSSTTPSVQQSTKKVAESKSESSEVAKESSSSAEAVESSSEANSLPRVKADQMVSFIDYLKQDLTDKGVDISTYTFYNRDTILYVNVPNDYKAYNRTDLQAFADGFKDKVHEAFNVWAATNGVDFKSYPMFHIKTDDGNSLASQKLNGEMKIKVKTK